MKITSEEARWLRQLVGPTQKKAPESVRRKLLSLKFVVQNAAGMEITEEGRRALQQAGGDAP